MVKKIQTLLLAFLCVLLIGFVEGCSEENDDYSQLENTEVDDVLSRALDNAVYNEVTETWMLPQNDPYTLENFQNAYDNLSAGKATQTLTRSGTEEFAETKKLVATHYAVKFYPKNFSEQRELELMDDVNIVYIPFNYTQLTEKETEIVEATTTRSGAVTYPERSKYTVKYDDYETLEGFVDNKVYTMPVLYAVWPTEKIFPDDIEYEIDYEVFLPQNAIQTRSSSLTEGALIRLEREAIALALGISYDEKEITTRAATANEIFSGKFEVRDSRIGRQPAGRLGVSFQLGTNIYSTLTDDDGYFTRL
jgi:hypothetical protein